MRPIAFLPWIGVFVLVSVSVACMGGSRRWHSRARAGVGGKAAAVLLVMALTLCAVLSISAPARADMSTDPRIQGARQCTMHFAQHERRHGIPQHLLSAISITESGRWNKRMNMKLPWPWTLNAAGKGYYFDTKAEAVAKVKSLRSQGVRSIDVGCMQINLHYHGHAFRSVEEALDPAANVAYAARFLREGYDRDRSWKKAMAAYHSRTPSLGEKYSQRVRKEWQTIETRLAEHRGSDPRRTQVASAGRSAPQSSRTQFSRAPEPAPKPGVSVTAGRQAKLVIVDAGSAAPLPRNAIRVVRPELATAARSMPAAADLNRIQPAAGAQEYADAGEHIVRPGEYTQGKQRVFVFRD